MPDGSIIRHPVKKDKGVFYMIGKIKKTLSAVLGAVIFITIMTPAIAYNGWADEYIEYCVKEGIISGDENGDIMPDANLTREQMVKIIMESVAPGMISGDELEFSDVSSDRWSYSYICAYSNYLLEIPESFMPAEYVTREEFLAMALKVAGFDKYEVENIWEFDEAFSDWEKIDARYYTLLAIGYENSCVSGADGLMRPKDKLTRAETCAAIYKIMTAVENKRLEEMFGKVEEENSQTEETEPEEEIPPRPETTTYLIAPPEATLQQAKEWARQRGATDAFIEGAELYWKYGEITGLRPDVLYCQSAKETAYGKYTGQVKAEQNNWAGIKKYGQNGDAPEDHEDFETPDDGVRAHFNHIGAYVGIEPVGEPHGRYKSVKSLTWAGTVETVEQLGGKWCPDKTYGFSIIDDYLAAMLNTEVEE